MPGTLRNDEPLKGTHSLTDLRVLEALGRNRQLRQAALVAEQDPETVAHALLTARRQLVTDHTGLASWLGIDADRLATLALEPRPDPAAPTFDDQVRELAMRFDADQDRLVDALA